MILYFGIFVALVGLIIAILRVLKVLPDTADARNNLIFYSGMAVVIIGLILMILDELKIVSYTASIGLSLILLGDLLIGLSFIPKPTDEEADGSFGAMSAFERLTKIFYAPSEVFQNLRRHPRWLIAVLVMTLFSAGFTLAFQSRIGDETIANFAIDKSKEISFIANNPDALESIEQGRKDTIERAKSPITKAITPVSDFVKWVFIFAFIGLLCWLFALAMGGKLNYWQAFSAIVYSFFPVVIIHRILSFVLLYLKEPVEIHPLLGQSALVQDNLGFLVSPAEHPVLYIFLGAFSLLMFYWIFLLATGLKNAGERVTSTIGWTTAISLYVIFILLMMTWVFIFPSFLS